MRIIISILFAVAFKTALAADTSKGEWPYYAGTIQATKYSPLAQIDAKNVKSLQIAWEWNSPDEALLASGATRERVSKLSLRYSTGLRLFTRAATTGTLTLGADRTELVRERLGTFAVSGGLGTELAALYRDDVANTGVFGQFKVNVGRSLFLTAGLRGDRNSSFGDQIGTAWSPMLGAAWTRDIGQATLKLRTAYGRGIRPPARPGR